MKICRWVVIALIVASFLPAYAAKEPVTNRTKWATVKLPFRPFDISASGDSFWICGLDESIAVSKDKGATWKVAHQQLNGEVLLHLEFIDQQTAHAAGTGGLLLSTTDGGETWTSHKSEATLKQFSFADARNGIAEVGGHVELTSDGGASWIPVTAMQDDPHVKPFSQIESIAALSPTNFAIALHQDQGENIVLSTIDAGKTWVPTHIEDTFAGSIFARNGEYWAFGIEYLGRGAQPRRGV